MPIITRNDAHLAYSDTGAGAPPLLLVHGWGGDRSHFTAQVDAFRDRHRIVTIDRRGHGESSARPTGWTIEDDADDLAWACRELALHRPVLIVHSQGGLGLAVAARHPELLSALVLLDPPLFPPAPVRAQLEGAAAAIESPAWRQVVDGLCDQLAFVPSDDRAIRARVHDRMVRYGQDLLATTWRAFLGHDDAAAAARCRVPLLAISSTMPLDADRLRALCPQAWIGRAVGAGHFAHLMVPDQVNPMIARFVAEHAAAPPR